MTTEEILAEEAAAIKSMDDYNPPPPVEVSIPVPDLRRPDEWSFEWLRWMPAGVYHSDPCESPSLSASCAKTLVADCPLRAWLEHPRLGGQSREPSDEMTRGDVIHALVLGQPLSAFAILHFDDYRTKASRSARDEVLEQGLTPVLARHLDSWRNTATRIRRNIEALGISLDGDREGTILWKERADDGTIVNVRSRLDLVQAAGGCLWILDLKNTVSAHPDNINRSIINFGYDLQAAAYMRAVDQVAPEWQGRVRFLFLFAESTSPNIVTPVELDAGYRQLGFSKWRRAVNLWAKCLKENHWPAYASEPIRMSPEQWALRKEIDNQPASDSTNLSSFLEH